MARTVSPTPLLFVAQRPSTYSGEHGKILRRLEVRWERSGALEHKGGNISETRKTEEMLQWRAYM